MADHKEATEVARLEFRDLFTSHFRKALVIGVTLVVFQKITSLNTSDHSFGR